MSGAFVKEGDDMWLRDIPPTMDALINYLTRENGGIRITEKNSWFSKVYKKQVHKMSDGFLYMVQDNSWVQMEDDGKNNSEEKTKS